MAQTSVDKRNKQEDAVSSSFLGAVSIRSYEQRASRIYNLVLA